MKAEHRKELETNILADKMGRMITGAKQGPSRSIFYYAIFAVILMIALFIVYRIFVNRSEDLSIKWAMLEDGGANEYETEGRLWKDPGNPGKAARFQVAWQDMWFKGIKLLGANANVAKRALEESSLVYESLAKSCKGDPVFEPEALYALAVIQETRAIDDREKLTQALTMYKDVVKSNSKSAFAELARKRIDELEDPDKLREIQRFYFDLGEATRQGPPMFPGFPNLPPNLPPLKN